MIAPARLIEPDDKERVSPVEMMGDDAGDEASAEIRPARCR